MTKRSVELPQNDPDPRIGVARKQRRVVRDVTRRTRGISLPQLIEELRPYLIGWRSYFGFCQTPRVLTNLEAWIRRRLRSYLWRQWRNGHNRFNELRCRGVPKFHAAVAARSPTGFWRMSGHPAVQQALRNHYFDSLGLPDSMSLSQLNLVKLRGTRPVCPVVWEGWHREVSPYPDLRPGPALAVGPALAAVLTKRELGA
jgi:hypothetical protein